MTDSETPVAGPNDLLPIFDLLVESRMSEGRATAQLASGLLTVDGEPVTDPATLVRRRARVVIRGQ